MYLGLELSRSARSSLGLSRRCHQGLQYLQRHGQLHVQHGSGEQSVRNKSTSSDHFVYLPDRPTSQQCQMQILASHNGHIYLLFEPFKRPTAEARRPWRIAGSSFFNACSFLRRFVFRRPEACILCAMTPAQSSL